MSTSSDPDAEPRAVRVAVDARVLTVEFADGRVLSTPLSWFPRLLQASAEARANWRFIGEGEGIHWPDIDEDLSVVGLLRGTKAPGSTRRAV